MKIEMKDSGIDWIGEIPKHWEEAKLKNVLWLKTGTTPKSFEDKDEFDELINWYTPSDVSEEGNVIFTSERKLAKRILDLEHISLYPKGSIMFVGIGALAGKVGYAIDSGYSNQQITALIPKSTNGKFYYYFLLADKKRIRDNAFFTTLPIINNGYLGQVKVLLPSEEEQSRIANFLDKKCAEIDELIALQEQMIAQLNTYKQAVITETVTKGLNPNVKMKDSGVEWIGEIPEHWDVCKLKYLTNGNLQYGANESGVTYDANLPRYVRITDILDNTLRENITKLSLTEEQAKDYILQNNDLLFARSGATVGKAFIYDELYGRCAFAGYLIRASINNENSAKFVYYYTQTSMYEEWKKQVFVQSTIQNIGADK